jgi:hypothetical protein
MTFRRQRRDVPTRALDERRMNASSVSVPPSAHSGSEAVFRNAVDDGRHYSSTVVFSRVCARTVAWHGACLPPCASVAQRGRTGIATARETTSGVRGSSRRVAGAHLRQRQRRGPLLAVRRADSPTGAGVRASLRARASGPARRTLSLSLAVSHDLGTGEGGGHIDRFGRSRAAPRGEGAP